MSVTMPRSTLLACLLLMACIVPSSSWALGLGEIHLNSSLNEPMSADIDLVAAAPDELTALRASLAGRDAFTRYGIDRPPFLSSLTFKVGKGKDGRDALLVRSSEAIPEPFVTFLVEVNWARGRLMREYTVLLDPPVYTPGETARSAAAVTAPTTGSAPSSANTAAQAAAASAGAAAAGRTRRHAPPSDGLPGPAVAPRSPAVSESAAAGSVSTGEPITGSTYSVGKGDTLSKIARALHANSPGDIDQTMIAVYRANPEAFGGNINLLKRGAVLRVPGADEIAALNQTEALGEVHRQMDSWHSSAAGASNGHLRLVTPTGNAGGGESNAAPGETSALKDRVKELEGQLAETRRLIDIKNSELGALQRKLGVPVTPPPATPAPVSPVVSAPPVTQTAPPAATAPAAAPPPTVVPPPVDTTPPVPVAPPAATAQPNVAPPGESSGSLLDWLTSNWLIPLAVILLALIGLAFAAMRRRRSNLSEFGHLEATDVAHVRDPSAKILGPRRGEDSFVVEESGEHRLPEFGVQPDPLGDTHSDLKSPEDTLSSESAVNLDQGDPLAEADFHMAYGLYDQAADLVRIALEREPDRRDLRLKLLEIYFVWGNKDAFLQTAKGLEATRDRAPAGEWDKIVIMGKQICPDEALFAASPGSGRGAGALVDLNLEGGENRVDIDLFGDPEGERSNLDHLAKETADTAATGESPGVRTGSDLDFTLDTPERGNDHSPTREMPPRDEPTVESELMNFSDAPTAESPMLEDNEAHGHTASKLGSMRADQTAEVSIDDLGLNLDGLEETGDAGASSSHLEETDHPADAPTMLAGLDDKSRRMMADAERSARDRDLTQLERELEASFIADVDSGHDEVKTAVLGPESAPTLQMPRSPDLDPNVTSRFSTPEFSDLGDKHDVESTSTLRSLSGDSIDLDLDRLASALGSGDTVEQPRAEEEVFSTEVFEASQRSKRVDLDVGEAMNGPEAPTNKLAAISSADSDKLAATSGNDTNKLRPVDLSSPELEPVTMSEVGTKLDLARAYMDMGDPEGARSILEEVVSEGSASQKQEAQRLIETLPG